MTLPPDFQFNQNNIQDYVDCARRFELKHFLKQPWPAVPSEPLMEVEKMKAMGQRFHLLVQQDLTGIRSDELERSINDPELFCWWQSYKNYSSQIRAMKLEIEYPSTIPFSGFSLTAKYDLLVFHTNGKVTIIDWKTSRKRLPSINLIQRIQSIVYPFILFEFHNLFGLETIKNPEDVEMLYWFTNYPDEPERIAYSSELHKTNHRYLSSIIQEIDKTDPGDFLLTENNKLCQFCIYRSLCQRGTQAGYCDDNSYIQSENDDDLINLNFDHTGEIPF